MHELQLPIRTARLVLRAFEARDLDDILPFHSDPQVTAYLYWEARDREQTREALEKKVRQTTLDGDGSSLVLAVELAGKVIGEMTLHCASRAHRQGEIGFMFNPAYHGQGYATEASLVVLELGFSVFGFHRIVGCCDARNAASYRLMERLGMRREAHLLENEHVKGEWVSEMIYAMLAAEWRARRGQAGAGQPS